MGWNMAKMVLSRKRVVEQQRTLMGYEIIESYEIVERDTQTGEVSYSKQEFKRTPVRTKTNVVW